MRTEITTEYTVIPLCRVEFPVTEQPAAPVRRKWHPLWSAIVSGAVIGVILAILGCYTPGDFVRDVMR